MPYQRRAPSEPVYQNTEPANPHHHVGHTDTCGLVGLYTFMACLGGCGALIPWPSSKEGPMSHYCPPCWEKFRPSNHRPALSDIQAQILQAERRLERIQDHMTMPDAKPEPDVYQPTAEERAWAQEEIRRQKAAAGLEG